MDMKRSNNNRRQCKTKATILANKSNKNMREKETSLKIEIALSSFLYEVIRRINENRAIVNNTFQCALTTAHLPYKRFRF